MLPKNARPWMRIIQLCHNSTLAFWIVCRISDYSSPSCCLPIVSNIRLNSFPLPLFMLRIQRANNINMSLPGLPSLSPNTLLNRQLHPLYFHSQPQQSRFSFCPRPSIQPIEGNKHTLQPSHNFFTELRTFIPLTCSPNPICGFNTGLRRHCICDCNASTEIVLELEVDVGV
jgi:hypothetical protein